MTRYPFGATVFSDRDPEPLAGIAAWCRALVDRLVGEWVDGGRRSCRHLEAAPPMLCVEHPDVLRCRDCWLAHEAEHEPVAARGCDGCGTVVEWAHDAVVGVRFPWAAIPLSICDRCYWQSRTTGRN